MTSVAESIVSALARQGVTTVWGVVGDALNPVTDAIRRQDGMEWIGVRHEEAGAFAASAQAQLTGRLGVCMGTVGPGSIHLLNGLYDAKKSHAPVLALCGQVPLAELGSDFFQEVDNDALFRDVAVFCRTITSPDQLPGLLEQAVQVGHAHGELAHDRARVDRLEAKGLAGVVGTAQHQLTELHEAALAEPGQVDHSRQRVQRLGGADVVRGLLAPDVLLARLEREQVAA